MKQYDADPLNWENENINSGGEAIALLMGLKPEPWLRYYSFLKKYSGLRDWNSLPVEDQKEKTFIDEYGAFLSSAFPSVSCSALFDMFEAMQSRAEWLGDFRGYAQCLYDGGIVFKGDVVEGLALLYSPNSWAKNFYKEWLDKRAWTFEEAFDLFEGGGFIDLRQYSAVAHRSPFKELLERHIIAGDIARFANTDYFDPKDIIDWLSGNVPSIPSPLLLESLGLNKIKKNRGRPKNSGVINDDEHVQEMKKLLDQKDAKSVHDAACQVVVGFSVSGASYNSKVRRLIGKYNKASPA